jgi:hypothetical protein
MFFDVCKNFVFFSSYLFLFLFFKNGYAHNVSHYRSTYKVYIINITIEA